MLDFTLIIGVVLVFFTFAFINDNIKIGFHAVFGLIILKLCFLTTLWFILPIVGFLLYRFFTGKIT